MPEALNTTEQFLPQPVKTNLLGLSVSARRFLRAAGGEAFSRHANGEVDSPDGRAGF